MAKTSPAPRLLLNVAGVHRALARIARAIVKLNPGAPDLVLVGIQTGGVSLALDLAQRLQSAWGRPIPVGKLDVSMHRDDLDRHLAPPVHPTAIPCDVTGKTVVLVDDVLFSGRTIRAALDALNDFGRPQRTQLAVLIDRGHRELPIRADFVGKTVATSPADRIEVSYAEPNGATSVTLIQPGQT
jgi:pyrimidine operon attenuation protein/uracil phosphoribosyltransferase